MQKTGIFLFIVLAFLSCENAINITAPTILIENSTPSVLDNVYLNVQEHADIDGVPILPDYYDWFVERSNGEVVATDFPDSSTVNWIPQEAGYFLIKVKIGYDNNKSTTAIREITVTESAISLQKKVIGHWKGMGRRGSGGQWTIELFIEENRYYYGFADFNDFDTYCENGIFNVGRMDYFHGPVNGVGSYMDSCGIPGEIPCQAFNITGIKENKGFGKITIGNISIYTDYTDTSCNDIEFEKLIVDENNLYFEFNNLYDNPPTVIDLIKQY